MEKTCKKKESITDRYTMLYTIQKYIIYNKRDIIERYTIVVISLTKKNKNRNTFLNDKNTVNRFAYYCKERNKLNVALRKRYFGENVKTNKFLVISESHRSIRIA